MSELYHIESSLMRSIIENALPNGLVNDDGISQMTKEEKEELYQKQKFIIQEFQKKSDQEINVFTSILRNLNEDLLSIRKNQTILDNSKTSEISDDLPVIDKYKECRHIEHSPPRLFKSNINIISHKRQFSLGVLPKKSIKNYRPPFRH